jgi:hypothetical protein
MDGAPDEGDRPAQTRPHATRPAKGCSGQHQRVCSRWRVCAVPTCGVRICRDARLGSRRILKETTSFTMVTVFRGYQADRSALQRRWRGSAASGVVAFGARCRSGLQRARIGVVR